MTHSHIVVGALPSFALGLMAAAALYRSHIVCGCSLMHSTASGNDEKQDWNI